MNKWTLNIQEFGKIKNASIEVSPFMIFVGDNNSGKSYIMELLWAIIKDADSIIRNLKKIPEYNIFLAEQVNKSPYKITEEVQEELLTFFNKAFEMQKEKFIKKIFNYDVTAEDIRIKRNDYFDLHYEMRMEQRTLLLESDEDDEQEVMKNIDYIKTSIYLDDNRVSSFLIQKSDDDLNEEQILHSVYTRIILLLIRKDYYNIYTRMPFRTMSLNREPLYFPASRTGFMHTYRAIIGNQRDNAENNEEIDFEFVDKNDKYQIAGTNLTLPTILFLEKLQKLTLDEDKRIKYEDEINFLNENILEGNVLKNSYEQYEFIPKDSDKGIPLHVTSSLVAELSPIVMFLSSSFDSDLWIIEEIESHLHPKIQLEVARFLVRLYNKQKCIWITTHSDSLIQKVNNLITLSLRNDKKRILNSLGFSDNDIFSNVDEISTYQFQSNKGSTSVEKLEMEPYGFEISSFNNTLEKLIIETSEIQNLGEEEND